MSELWAEWVAAMRAERFEAAWTVSRRALDRRDPATRDDPAVPYHLRWVWDGRDITDRHTLVRCYRGLGDTLQCARFLPALAERAASLTVEVQPCLMGLLAGLPGAHRLVPFDPAHPLPPSECDLEITELDFALGLAPSAAPPPYLAVTPAILPAGTIALCDQAGDWDPQRSIPPALLAPLCRGRHCITLTPGPSVLDVANPDGCPLDMNVTAALVAGAALVITVDTMIAHLAGAMGKPVWVLLKAKPDWRWSPALGRSAWYPSARLYQQPRPGDWTPVVAQVEADLLGHEARLAEGRA